MPYVGQDLTLSASRRELDKRIQQRSAVHSGQAGPVVPQNRSAAQRAMDRRIATTRDVMSGSRFVPADRTSAARSRAITDRGLQQNRAFRDALNGGR